uniref:Putative secreted protein synganglion overexpressed n=1 Tax=Rhipicephalus microplus TaxID=6941 RepID=A0A6M2DD63_RHIMP
MLYYATSHNNLIASAGKTTSLLFLLILHIHEVFSLKCTRKTSRHETCKRGLPPRSTRCTVSNKFKKKLVNMDYQLNYQTWIMRC